MLPFSIIITCHNQEQFIRHTVDSALAQPFAGREVIVVDDASSDGSVQLLEQFGDRIRLLKQPINQGPNAARNLGASVARGRFLVFLDGDDLLLPWALDSFARIISLHQPAILLGRLLFFSGPPPSPGFLSFGPSLQVAVYPHLIRKDRTYRGSASAIVVDRDVFAAAGGWTLDLFPSDIDDLALKLAYSGRTVHILSHPTTLYRIHENNTVHQVGRFLDSMSLLVRKEKLGGYPGGAAGRFERRAFLGGPVFFWFHRGLRARLYWRSLKFLASGSGMVLAGILSRVRIKLRGRSPLQSVEMPPLAEG